MMIQANHRDFESNDYIPVEDYANSKGVPKENVIKLIRDGGLSGRIKNDHWYVNMPLSGDSLAVRFVAVDDYASDNGISKESVVKMIKEGELAGQLKNGSWFVDLKLSDQSVLQSSSEPSEAAAHSKNQQRPKSVTVIGWIIIASSLAGLALWGLVAISLATSKNVPDEVVGIVVILFLAVFVQLAIGAGILKAKNWARSLYLWLTPIGIVFSLIAGNVGALIAAVAYIIFAYHLTRPKVRAYFGLASKIDEKPPEVLPQALPQTVPSPQFADSREKKAGHEDSALYKKAYDEITSGQTNEALWIKALTETEGDEDKAKFHYITLRVQQLAETTGSNDSINQNNPSDLEEDNLPSQLESQPNGNKIVIEPKQKKRTDNIVPQESNRYISVADFAKSKGLSSDSVVQKIKDGELAGQLKEGHWFVDLKLSGLSETQSIGANDTPRSNNEESEQFVPVEDYAKERSLTSKAVIQMIREGELTGRLKNGHWFVDLGLFKPLVMKPVDNVIKKPEKSPIAAQREMQAVQRQKKPHTASRHITHNNTGTRGGDIISRALTYAGGMMVFFAFMGIIVKGLSVTEFIARSFPDVVGICLVFGFIIAVTSGRSK